MRSGMWRPIRYFAPLGVQWRTQALPIIVAFVCTETSVPGGIAFSASTSIPKLLMSMARAWRMRSPSLPRQQRRTWRWTERRACSRLPAPFSVTAPACFGSDCGRLMARLRTQHLCVHYCYAAPRETCGQRSLWIGREQTGTKKPGKPSPVSLFRARPPSNGRALKTSRARVTGTVPALWRTLPCVQLPAPAIK